MALETVSLAFRPTLKSAVFTSRSQRVCTPPQHATLAPGAASRDADTAAIISAERRSLRLRRYDAVRRSTRPIIARRSLMLSFWLQHNSACPVKASRADFRSRAVVLHLRNILSAECVGHGLDSVFSAACTRWIHTQNVFPKLVPFSWSGSATQGVDNPSAFCWKLAPVYKPQGEVLGVASAQMECETLHGTPCLQHLNTITIQHQKRQRTTQVLQSRRN